MLLLQNTIKISSFICGKKIPNEWLYKNASSESYDSIGSCYDGVDNDFDGKIDMEDSGCFQQKPKK